jgi:hypothetical protein
MKSFGNINFQQNLAQQLAFEVESGFPAEPVVGRVIFTNKRLYICVEIADNTPVWIPLTNEVNTYTYVQETPSDTWTIEHDLVTTTPLVQVYEPGPSMVIPDEINIIDNSTIEVKFGTAIAGTAVVMYGDINGGQKSEYAYTHYQTDLDDEWVIDHNLGYNPIVRVFIGTEEVQPASINFPTLNQAVITFSMPRVGVARLV